MTSHYRHLRSFDPAASFPLQVQPGEIIVNTANRQIAVGDADAASVGTPKPLLAVRYFDAAAQYMAGDIVVQAGNLYRANSSIPPGAFNVANWTQIGAITSVTADIVTVTPVGNVSATNVQAAIAEVDSEYRAADSALTTAYQNADTAIVTAYQAADTALTTSVNGKVAKGGDTMTGLLTLSANPSAALHAATKQYVDANAGGVTVSDTPPASPKAGQLWWESDSGLLYVYYNDGNTSQWVIAAPQPDTSTFATKPYADAYAPHGQCYLWFVSATQVQLSPKDGNSIKIGGLIYKIPSAGVVASNASLAANTVYLVYLYNNAGTLTLEFSTTGHGPSSADGVECKNTDYTRTLVGMVYTNGAAQFQNSGAFLGVLSWFNRKLKYGAIGIGTFGPYGGAPTITGGNPGVMANWGDEPTYAVLAAQASMSGTYAQILVALDGQGTLPHGATTYCYGPTAGAVNMAIFIGGWQQNAEGAHQYNAAGGATSGSGALSMFNGQINMATRG